MKNKEELTNTVASVFKFIEQAKDYNANNPIDQKFIDTLDSIERKFFYALELQDALNEQEHNNPPLCRQNQYNFRLLIEESRENHSTEPQQNQR